MTFKDEIDKDGERFWKNAYEDRQTDVIDECVEKIDELECDLDNLRAAISHLDDRVIEIEKQHHNTHTRVEKMEYEIHKITGE